MKKAEPTSDAELRPEYRREDLGTGVRGKYYEIYVKEMKKDLPKHPGRRKLSATGVALA
jgi:hypothetical protein